MRLLKLIVIVFLIIACGTLLYQNQVLNPYPITIWLYPGYEVQLLLPIILALTFSLFDENPEPSILRNRPMRI